MEQQEKLANLMGHQVSTQRYYYRRQSEGKVDDVLKEWAHLRDYSPNPKVKDGHKYPHSKKDILKGIDLTGAYWGKGQKKRGPAKKKKKKL